MKAIAKGLMAGLAMFGVCYLMGAFAAAGFDISEWSEELREGIAFAGGAIGVFTVGLSALEV